MIRTSRWIGLFSISFLLTPLGLADDRPQPPSQRDQPSMHRDDERQEFVPRPRLELQAPVDRIRQIFPGPPPPGHPPKVERYHGPDLPNDRPDGIPDRDVPHHGPDGERRGQPHPDEARSDDQRRRIEERLEQRLHERLELENREQQHRLEMLRREIHELERHRDELKAEIERTRGRHQQHQREIEAQEVERHNARVDEERWRETTHIALEIAQELPAEAFIDVMSGIADEVEHPEVRRNIQIALLRAAVESEQTEQAAKQLRHIFLEH
ncbi:hypothetical protein [Roseiconus lacunae]|uniref:Uncharacterized protein n=1 Tax=Roseiconus lacunae TaxID=2605694 RepID=A0ABT7PPH8_9BACT|nr:hypothetical protein [Roseiconus lacunae]MDM4018415.1 hypothetical protein [Roseiconus lacunae]